MAMKAFSAFLGEIQHQSEAYAEVVKQIARNNPANMRTVKDKAELARRRELARELLKRNAELMNFWSSAEVRLREKFREFGASGDTAERMVSEFSTTFAKTLPTKRRIRVADETMFKTIISMCDLLEAEWVNWEVKEDELAFADDRDAVRYNELVNALKEAVQEQAAAQRQVVEQLNELQR